MFISGVTLAMHSSDVGKGALSGDHIYTNPVLGMRINLPEHWEFFTPEMQSRFGLTPSPPRPADPNCKGPFCNEDIDIAFISVPGTRPIGTIFLAGWKLPKEYLTSKNRIPLLTLAKQMTLGSMEHSSLKPISGLIPIRLGKAPAYRLTALNPKSQSKVFGYVAETHDHIFLLTVTPYPMSKAADTLQQSIESMALAYP